MGWFFTRHGSCYNAKMDLLPFFIAFLSTFNVGDFISPKTAIHMVTWALGRPDLAPELRAICARESKCKAVSIHNGDRSFARTMYHNAVRAKWLSPQTCKHHRGEVTRFGVRGAWGTSAAYTLWHLGVCLPPEVLDIPIVAAYATAKRMIYQCKRYRACDPKRRHELWAGIGKTKLASRE